ncbi:hypothetical protein N0V84_008630 [Fusarium piperis]|uniref:Uncharacterized protein n=1 Tax=Fusarium piperis TaxID=1435070 RepID=A0A9W8W7R4_9HYPO|nr:hypothetical protein N0V84_008630 [Fusarium piperis]
MKSSSPTPTSASATDVAATEHVCETTDGSSYLRHVDQLISSLREKKLKRLASTPASDPVTAGRLSRATLAKTAELPCSSPRSTNPSE